MAWSELCFSRPLRLLSGEPTVSGPDGGRTLGSKTVEATRVCDPALPWDSVSSQPRRLRAPWAVLGFQPQQQPPPRAAAGGRGRLLDDSALGWPGSGTSPARLVGSGRAGAPPASAIEEPGEEAPRSAGLGGRPGTQTGTGRGGATPGDTQGRRLQVGREPVVCRPGSASDPGPGPARGERAAGSPGSPASGPPAV